MSNDIYTTYAMHQLQELKQAIKKENIDGRVK